MDIVLCRSVGRSSDCRLQCLIKLLLLFMLAKTERRSVLGYNRVVHPTFTTGWLAGWLTYVSSSQMTYFLPLSMDGRVGMTRNGGNTNPAYFNVNFQSRVLHDTEL